MINKHTLLNKKNKAKQLRRTKNCIEVVKTNFQNNELGVHKSIMYHIGIQIVY